MTATPQVSFADLPDASQAQMVFHDSTWFRTHGSARSLPTPDQVRALRPPSTPMDSRPVVKFEELDLAVKFGDHVTVSEAVCLRTVGQLCSPQVPVPEVYGWVVEGREVFLYMELIRGPTLMERWSTMNHQDRSSVCNHLRSILEALRSTKQDPSMRFIGSFLNGPSTDRFLELRPSSGPWSSVASFHDWLSWLWRRHAPEPNKIADPWRQLLNDSSPIVLTHGDLHQSNIIVSATSPAYVLAIIDWEQSGWYPDHWEYCKTVYTVFETDDWRRWIDSILVPHWDVIEAFHFYVSALGP